MIFVLTHLIFSQGIHFFINFEAVSFFTYCDTYDLTVVFHFPVCVLDVDCLSFNFFIWYDFCVISDHQGI